ncbi:MAG: hypothetical protein ACM3UX_00625 [Candidatus Woesearchaeota archaeon]
MIRRLAADAPTGRRALGFALLWLLVAVGMMVSALVIVVAIVPIVWHLIASLPLLAIGTTALLLFSDGLDRWLDDDAKLRRASGAVHWASAALVALAIAVLAGILTTSLFGPSPTTGWAIVIDVVIGLIAGFSMVGVVALAGAVLGGFVAWVESRFGAGEERAGRLRAPLRSDWSWLVIGRGLALGVIGLGLSIAASMLLGPTTPKSSGAADTLRHHPSAWSTLGWPLLGWVLGTGAVWLAFAWLTSENTAPGTARRHATHASALAVALLILVAWLSASVLDGYARGSLSAGAHRVPRVALSQTSLTSSPALAQTFAPTFELAPGERWSPTSVDWYRAHATPDAHDQFCTGTSPPGHCLRLACPASGASTCDPCDSPDPPASCAPSGRELPALYYRYYTPTDARAAGDALPRGAHDWTLVQYWMFYNYDSLHAGIITQWHESDWEQVSVLVERDGPTVRPVEVAFSEHCYGAVVPAELVSWSGAHPISYVATGSHGNYPTQADLPIRELHCLTPIEPRYLGVAGLFFDPTLDGSASELPLAYVITLRDSTGRTSTSSRPELIPAESTRSIAGFDGYWGVDNNLTILAGRVRTGAGPRSPQKQNPWLRPFKAMFCAPTWLHVSARNAPPPHWVCG